MDINFNGVATESSITKASIYNKYLRERLEKLGQQWSQFKREIDDNNKNVIIAVLKRKTKKLEEENIELRDQVHF